MNLRKICKLLEKVMSPIFGAAFLLLLLALADHLTHPIGHEGLPPDAIFEKIIRGWFFFAGIFGLIGNGKTERVRGIMVTIPYIYLGTFYWISYFDLETKTLILPAIIVSSISVWLLLQGVTNELKQRVCSRFNNAGYHANNESNY